MPLLDKSILTPIVLDENELKARIESAIEHYPKSIRLREFQPVTFLAELLKLVKSGYIPDINSARFSDQLPQVIWMTKPKKVLDKEYQQIVGDITDKYKKEINDLESERLVRLEDERQRILLEREKQAFEDQILDIDLGA